MTTFTGRLYSAREKWTFAKDVINVIINIWLIGRVTGHWSHCELWPTGQTDHLPSGHLALRSVLLKVTLCKIGLKRVLLNSGFCATFYFGSHLWVISCAKIQKLCKWHQMGALVWESQYKSQWWVVVDTEKVKSSIFLLAGIRSSIWHVNFTQKPCVKLSNGQPADPGLAGRWLLKCVCMWILQKSWNFEFSWDFSVNCAEPAKGSSQFMAMGTSASEVPQKQMYLY